MQHALAFIRRALIVLLLGAANMPATAHDAPGNRATLVMREQGHLSLTVECDLLDALQRTAAPHVAPNAFLAQASAMNADAFAALWSQARRQWETAFVLMLPNGERVKARKWLWPLANVVHKGLREQLMQQLTATESATATHTHTHQAARIEFSADFVVAAANALPGALNVELSVAPAFTPLRLTTYKPQQHLVDRPTARIQLRF